MKYYLALLYCFFSVFGFSQSTLPLRADTVLIEKSGGNGELKIKNSTRDSLGILVNIGGGKTKFVRVRQITDSSFIIPPGGVGDTIVIRGTGSGSGSHNSNVGAGFRIAVPGTNNIKTLFGSFGLVPDSTSNTNGITFTIDSTKFSTTRATQDSMYRALNSMPMTAKIEFVQSGNSTTYQNDDLIGKLVLMVSGEGYIYGTVIRSSGYYSFNAGTGTITIHNSQFSDDDYVLILYRTTPIYVTDGLGNYIVDSNGNYIIAN